MCIQLPGPRTAEVPGMNSYSVWTLQIVPFNQSVGLKKGLTGESKAKPAKKGPVHEGLYTKPKSLNFDLSSRWKPGWFETRE